MRLFRISAYAETDAARSQGLDDLTRVVAHLDSQKSVP